MFAQRYTNAGAAAGTEFRLNEITTGDQVRAVVAPVSDGGFVAAWESRSLPGEVQQTDGVAARRFNSAGVASSTEVLVNTYTTGPQQDTTIAAIPSDEMIVAWESTGGIGENASKADESDSGIFARRLNAGGVPIGTEFQVNSYTTDEQDDPAAAALVDGGFVVVWEGPAEGENLAGMFGQRYTADVCGDANGDGGVTSPDAVQILKASISTAQACEKCRCDADGDGDIDTSDALNVLRAGTGDFSKLACKSC